MSDIYLTKNQVYHARMKHIDVRFHFVREILDEGDNDAINSIKYECVSVVSMIDCT